MAKYNCDFCQEPDSVVDDSPGFRAADANIFRGWFSSMCESCCEFAQKKGFDITKLAERKRLLTAFRPQDFKGYRRQRQKPPQSSSGLITDDLPQAPQPIQPPQPVKIPLHPQARLKKWVKTFALGGLLLGLFSYPLFRDPDTAVGCCVVCLIPIIVLLICVSNRCQNCKAWWSVSEIDRKRLRTYETTKSVNRKKERRDAKGELIHTETWREDFPVTMDVDDVKFKCKYCQNIHTEKRKHEV